MAGVPGGNTSGGGFKDWWQDNKSGIGSLFGNLIKGGADYAAADDIIKRLTDVGTGLAEGFTDLGQEAFSRSQFKPFTVTTGAGTTKATVDPETGEYSGFSTTLGTPGAAQTTGVQNIISGMLGPTGYNADPTGGMAGTIGTNAFTGANTFLGNTAIDPTGGTAGTIRDTALGGVGGLLGTATGSRASREQDIYNRIRSIQNPEEQRQQQLLNDRLLSQGRLGLSTSMYGGSPEQFAMEKARAEAMNQASLSAMDQASKQREADLGVASQLFGLGSGASMLPQQLAQGNLGLASGMFGLGGQAAQLPLSLQGVQGQNLAQMMGLQFMPEQQMLDALGAGTNLASIADEGRRYGAGLFDESTGSGLEAILQAELGKADFLKSLYSGAVGQGGGSSGGGWFDTIIDTIFGS